jgi:hypothetical protein
MRRRVREKNIEAEESLEVKRSLERSMEEYRYRWRVPYLSKVGVSRYFIALKSIYGKSNA